MDEHTIAVGIAKQYWSDMYKEVNFDEDQIRDHVKKWIRKMENSEKEKMIWDEVKRKLAEDKNGKDEGSSDEDLSTTKCGTDCIVL